MGDELAMLNDYGYRDVAEHAHDSRWLHRPRMDWYQAAARHAGDTPAARVFAGTKHILARRRATPALHAQNGTRILDAGDAGLFAFARLDPTGAVVCLFNFTEDWRSVPADWLLAQGAVALHEVLSDHPVTVTEGRVWLPPYARAWIA